MLWLSEFYSKVSAKTVEERIRNFPPGAVHGDGTIRIKSTQIVLL
jgi:hypothetical protein